jgi:hypothetical protein
LLPDLRDDECGVLCIDDEWLIDVDGAAVRRAPAIQLFVCSPRSC